MRPDETKPGQNKYDQIFDERDRYMDPTILSFIDRFRAQAKRDQGSRQLLAYARCIQMLLFVTICSLFSLICCYFSLFVTILLGYQFPLFVLICCYFPLFVTVCITVWVPSIPWVKQQLLLYWLVRHNLWMPHNVTWSVYYGILLQAWRCWRPTPKDRQTSDRGEKEITKRKDANQKKKMQHLL